MIFEELPEFTKDLKILLKKFRTLTEDLAVVKKVLNVTQSDRSGKSIPGNMKCQILTYSAYFGNFL